MSQASIGQIEIPNIHNSFAARVKHIRHETDQCIKPVAPKYKRGEAVAEIYINKLDQLLAWLDTCLEMTPQIKDSSGIERVLNIVADPNKNFPPQQAAKARYLLAKWENENWGRDFVADDSTSSDSDTNMGNAQSPTQTQAKQLPKSILKPSKDTEVRSILPPPRDHPIFGENGIMHGVVIAAGTKRRTYLRNPNYKARNAKVFGGNGLAVGAWWPIQLVALFNGAHASSQGGIAGSKDEGAYSIVVSGHYNDLDSDDGDTIFYSGSRAHENSDPRHPGDSSNATLSLKRSFATRRPVRVLRAASGKSHWAPSVGIRYDGLYRVTKVRRGRNKKGGVFEGFELQRLPGQTPLEEVRGTSPTFAQKRDYQYIADGYQPVAQQ